MKEHAPELRPYIVLVDDNIHYMDESERYELGRFATLADAIEVCRRLTMESLEHLYQPGMSAEALYDHYVSFGDDPFVVGPGQTEPPFSARKFAKSAAALVVQMMASDSR